MLQVADHFHNSTVCTPRLAAAAAVTSTLRVGSYVYANDFRHPVLLAREAAEIDRLSGGRMELGIGAGWSRSEYEMVGIPFDEGAVRAMNLVGRAGAAGDELGSSVIGSRLVSDLMRLAFLMERQYAPYSKWFGTAFSRLACGSELTPVLWDVGRAQAWQDREAALMTAYQRLAEMHDALGLTAPVTTKVVQLWDRPFKVAWADIPDLLLPVIQDPAVVSIAQRWPVGPVDQFRELIWTPKNRPLLLRLFD